MTVWDFSGSLVRLAVLFGALLALPFLWRWAGGRVRAYMIVAGGLLFMTAWDGVQVIRTFLESGLQPAGVAWDAVSVQAIGYIAILLGILVWIHDLRRVRDELKKSNLALQEVASTDFLTGLLSRRQASFLLSFETARARRSKLPLGFIMIDLDHFKKVNDLHGHAAGDAVLAHIGQILKKRLRTSDIVSRYGGEEFLVLVPAATLDGTVALASTLREIIERTPISFKGKTIQVTASFGVVVSHIGNDTNSAEEALRQADTALYAAKALGRNRVVNWEDVAPRPEELSAVAAN
jgi:diguanylate cyclase (GGDEF)-like protein